jgi:predicted dehydrogenase
MPEGPDHVRYNFEYERRIRVGFIGAGGHAWRNVYPAFRYAPVDLVAVCDLDIDRAKAYARQFGAERAYADHREMLGAEDLDAVFIVTAYEPDSRVTATRLALDALAAGRHVWMEKPTAASVAEVEQLIAASGSAGRIVMTGLKKLFFPTIAKVKEIICDAAFGHPTSVYVRYPQSIPRFERRSDSAKMLGLLDHIYHPGAILDYLMGPIERFSHEWEPKTGSSVASLRFASGAVGTLHLAGGASGSSPLERLEVVGQGANVVVENGAKLTYYRKATRPAYGRSASFLVPDDEAPLHWEPEFSLGQLNNNSLFLLGYAQEVQHFCDCVLEGRQPERGTLAQSLAIMKLYEAYRRAEPGVAVRLD